MSYYQKADDPRVFEIRQARADGSSIEQICRIWKLSHEEVQAILKSGFRRMSHGYMRSKTVREPR